MDGQSPEEATTANLSSCIRCGAVPVTVGPHCQRCALEVRQGVRDAVEDTQPPASAPRVATSRSDRDAGRVRAIRYRYDKS